MNVDKYLMKRFDRDKYNCWHFASEVWQELTGTSLIQYQPAVEAIAPKLTELNKPESPCLVLMQRQRCQPHVGIYYMGRVLHMNQRGAEYTAFDSATACFPTIKYYK